MILVLTVIIAIVFIIGTIMYTKDKNYNSEFVGSVLMGIFAFLLAVCVIAIIVLCVQVSNLNVLDDKIAMYEEENGKIETQIAEAVKQYQEYEHNIFIEVAPESAVTLVSLYPELKADTLVQKQLEIYIANNEQIKSLKAAKISGSVKRWWLYFGG